MDLAELWALRCSASQMAAMGITFEQLLAKGISPQIMAAFAMPLSDWSDLKFSAQHAEAMSTDDALRVFALPKSEPYTLTLRYASMSTGIGR